MRPVRPVNTLFCLTTIHEYWQNISAVLGHAIAANTEKVQAVIQNLEIVLERDLFFDFIQTPRVRVDDFFTFYADEMGMRVRPMTVIPVAAIGKAQFEHLAK
jgi:hypothetical protein